MGLPLDQLEADRAAFGMGRWWIPVVIPPRASDPYNGIVARFLAVGGMLVNADQGRGDHLHIIVVSG